MPERRDREIRHDGGTRAFAAASIDGCFELI